MPHHSCKKHGWSKAHTPPSVSDASWITWQLLRATCSKYFSPHISKWACDCSREPWWGPACLQNSSVMWDPGGPCPNLLGPVTATQRRVVRTARAMPECPPHLPLIGNSSFFPLAGHLVEQGERLVFHAMNVLRSGWRAFIQNNQNVFVNMV